MSFGIGIGDILKLCELSGRVYRNCRDCTGEYKSLTTEARSLTNLLEDIQDKYDKIPDNKRQQLVVAYDPCVEVLQELDKLLIHYNGLDTKSKRAWDRLTWDPEKSRVLRDRLVSSVSMLNTFYTSLVHDSQVLILEALERLEKDYKGGHREESIASIGRITSTGMEDGNEEDDAAWTQILRDLEDVGVSQQEALSYRDIIVDWLVAAVNEGRLLEQRPEQDNFFSLEQDLGASLPPLDLDTSRESQHLDVPPALPSVQRTQSAPFLVPLPASRHPILQDQRDNSNPSNLSLPTSGLSRTSFESISQSSDTDASSLYAPRQPTSNVTPPADPSTHQIRRVPVPLLSAAHVQTPATSTLLTASHLPVAAPSPPYAPPPIPEPTAPVEPPSYYEKGTSTTADLQWTAQQIIAAWSRRDFNAAEKHLVDQLAAVERGQTVTPGTQPDRRILRHLIGVACSFNGNFVKAKRYFESVFNGIYLNRQSLDDGDIAAARWLGDVCLHLREHSNALLAYSVAFEGSIGRFGIARDRTQRVAMELRLLDHWLSVFRRIEHAFELNVDPTNIFTTTHAVEKSNLLVSVKARLYEMNIAGDGLPPPPMAQWIQPHFTIGLRPKAELMISRGFLLGPLIAISTWPLPWDMTFSPTDCVQIDRDMNTLRVAKFVRPLLERTLPTNTLGDSKKLHYLTKRGSQWLIESVKKGLHDLGIEHAEHASETSILCCLNQHRDGLAFSEGIKITFMKLHFRNVYGIKISNVMWSTRRIAATSVAVMMRQQERADFRDMVKGILEQAEAEAENPTPATDLQYAHTPTYPYVAPPPFEVKRPTYS